MNLDLRLQHDALDHLVRRLVGDLELELQQRAMP
jgi:hypothetical protein